jgi:hypothetical protein
VEREPTSTVIQVCAEHSPDGSGELDARATRRLELDLDAFAHEALGEVAGQLGVSVEELASFAVLYYLADRDSGRIARRPPMSPPDESHPLGKLLGG